MANASSRGTVTVAGLKAGRLGQGHRDRRGRQRVVPLSASFRIRPTSHRRPERCPGLGERADQHAEQVAQLLVPASLADVEQHSLSDDEGALMEPLSVGIWACREAGVSSAREPRAGGRAGPIGLLALQVARAFGATEVTVSDTNERRLALAERTGAPRVVTPGADFGEADALIECSGHPAALADGIAAIRRAGTAVAGGMGAPASR